MAYKLEAAAVHEDKAIKAFKPGYDVTTDPAYQDGVEVPPLRDDYEICKRFEGADPSLEVGPLPLAQHRPGWMMDALPSPLPIPSLPHPPPCFRAAHNR